MKKFIAFLGKVIAFFVVLILIVVIPLSLLALDTGRVVFNEETVKRVVTDAIVESDLASAVFAWYSMEQAASPHKTEETQPKEDDLDIYRLLMFLDNDDWKSIRSEIVPDDIIEEWVSVTVDEFNYWVDSNEMYPQIIWKLTPLKDRMMSEHGVSAVLVVFESLPSCTEEQVADFVARANSNGSMEETPFNLCRFPEPFLKHQLQGFRDSLSDIVDAIPASIDLTDEFLSAMDVTGEGPDAVRLQMQWARMYLKIVPFIPFILLLLIFVLAIRSTKAWGWWWGLPLVFGGLVAGLISTGSNDVITYLLTVGPMTRIPAVIRSETLDAVHLFAQEVFQPMFRQSVVIFVIGLVLVLIGMGARGERE